MADYAEILESMSTEEINAKLISGPYNHIRVFLTDDAEKELGAFAEKTMEAFVKPHFQHKLKLTRAIALNEGASLDFEALARYTFQSFFDALGSFAAEMEQEDFERMMHQFASRLTINCVFGEYVKGGQELRSLTTLVDVVPMDVFDDEEQFNGFNQFRILHEATLSHLH